MPIKRKSPKESPALADGLATPGGPARRGAEPRRSHGRDRPAEPGPACRTGGADAVAGPGRIDPLAMTVAQASKVLSAVGVGAVTEELIRRHIAAGAPSTSDPSGAGARINLVHYAAWLNLPADHAGHRMGLPACDAQAGEHGA